jgi:hypothetical protein
MEIRVYFEGHRMLRQGFERFYSELRSTARQLGSEISFIAARDGPSMYRKAASAHPNAWNILLKDSEDPMPRGAVTLCKRHGIDPSLVGNVFWMVELMEAWFLADSDALATYYGQRFSSSAIGQTLDVERIPKSEVLRRLKYATKETTKGEYNKVAHAPALLSRLDPKKVVVHARHCRRLFETVNIRLASKP